MRVRGTWMLRPPVMTDLLLYISLICRLDATKPSLWSFCWSWPHILSLRTLDMTLNCLHRVIYLQHLGANDLLGLEAPLNNDSLSLFKDVGAEILFLDSCQELSFLHRIIPIESRNWLGVSVMQPTYSKYPLTPVAFNVSVSTVRMLRMLCCDTKTTTSRPNIAGCLLVYYIILSKEKTFGKQTEAN